MPYIWVILGISLTLGTFVGLVTALNRIGQLISGECSPYSSDEVKHLLKPKRIVLFGIIVGGLLGEIVWLFWGWSFTETFAEGVPTGGIVVFFAIIALFLGIIGGIMGGIMGGVSVPVAFIVHHLVFSLGSRLVFSFLGFKIIICQHCLRYTHPSMSHYRQGIRSCEYCRKAVERTAEPGKVILAFGTISPKTTGRIFVRENPDFDQHSSPDETSAIFFRPPIEKTYQHRRIDVAEVYIDTMTYDPLLLEKFLTHITNYPPLHGLDSVRVFYRGTLEHLHDANLKNALHNVFHHIEQIS